MFLFFFLPVTAQPVLQAVSLQAERAGLLHRDQQLLVQHGVRRVRRQVQAVKTRVSPDRDRKTKTHIVRQSGQVLITTDTFLLLLFKFTLRTLRRIRDTSTSTNTLTFWVICSFYFLPRGRSDLYRCHVYNSTQQCVDT